MLRINSAGISSDVVDLRSDTVTQPTEEMYSRMMAAKIGDDGLDGDPSAHELEATAAEMMGKEAALFTPSCTMANLLAVLAQVQRAEQVVLEAESHMYLTERGGAAIAGAFYAPVPGEDGAMPLDLVDEALRSNRSRLKTAMVAMETSHNNAGGTVMPLDHMAALFKLGREHGAAIHLDGARLLNAAVHLRVAPAEIAKHCDTVSVCLSKGLSAPLGAIVAGGRDVVSRMRSLRKALGGQQRQVGIVAAAGLEALTTMGGRLIEDHTRARMLSAAINKLETPISAAAPQTNIVLADVSGSGRSPQWWVDELAKINVLVRPWSRGRLRCVTHRHVTDDDLARVTEAFRLVGAAARNAEVRVEA